MPKLILFACLASLLACSTDPLEVQTIEVDETAPADGLTSLADLRTGEEWTRADGVLTATGPATLELLPNHEALTVAMSFRFEEGSQAELLLNDTYAVQLPGVEVGDSAVRRSNAVASPGKWQDLELAYQPARGSAPALLVAAYLNGNLVYYQEVLGEDGPGGGPLVLRLTTGTMSITDIRTSDRAGKSSNLASNGEVELHLPLIQYAYYPIEGQPDDVTNWGTLTPSKEGYIGRFDLNAIRDLPTGYAVRFTSELDIPKAGEYTFTMFSPSSTRFYIDDQLVIDKGGRGNEFEGEGSIQLSEGTHEVRLDHYQYGGWNRLNLAYLNGNGEAVSFNDIPEGRAVATPPTGEGLELETDDRPYLLRSFLNFPPTRIYDFTEKRTHVVNVGEAEGPHYSYDLHNGSLLQMWRGDFVDVGEMWVGRGEPQTARALGSTVALDGRPQWSGDGGGWPDTLADLRHLRYELDEAGRPTYFFDLDGSTVTDRIIPQGGGLVRTLSNTGGDGSVYTQLASARSIRETAPGNFELQGPGLTISVEELAAGGLRILEGERTNRLVAELPAGEHISYRIDW